MGRLQLKAAFLAGTSVGISAEDVFTDRVSELDAFTAALEHTRNLRKGPYGELFRDPRQNILCFYGAGGIGKTALSERLEQEARRPPPAHRRRRVSTCRLDLANAQFQEPETVVLGLRGALGRLQSDWTAFDLAFGVYWERSHPGQPITEFLSHHGALAKVAAEVRLADQIHTTIDQALQVLGPLGGILGVGRQSSRWIFNRIREVRAHHRLLDNCPNFNTLLDADADDETLTYLPSLLAWELSESSPAVDLELVVFIDTFEELERPSTRRIEQLLQRVCYMMPNVLFVITGRNRLDWADLTPPSELDFVGSRHWPYLAGHVSDGEPRQHLLGYLNEHDCRTFLRSVFAASQVGMARPIEDAIVRGSGGLPLYLDLEVSHYLQLLGENREPRPEQFGGPLAAVVSRTMRDMSSAERLLLRAASILQSFDGPLIEAVAGDVRDIDVHRFLGRPFVEQSNGVPCPYRIHDTLRDAVRTVDPQLRDGWSDTEWRTAAERAMLHLGDYANQAKTTENIALCSAAFASGSSLAVSCDITPDWLIVAAEQLSNGGYWTQLNTPANGSKQALTPGVAIMTGIRGVAERRLGRLAQSIESLDRSLAYPGLSEYARRYFALSRANSRRNFGEYDKAAIEYRDLAMINDLIGQAADVQLQDLSLLDGDFRSLLEEEPPPSGDDSHLALERMRIYGHAARFGGEFSTAEVTYRTVLRQAERSGSLALQGKALTNLAETMCWVVPIQARHEALDAVDFNRGIGNRLEVTKALTALGIANSPNHPLEAETAFEGSLRVAHDVGYVAGELFCRWGMAFATACIAELDALRDTIQVMDTLCSQIGKYRFVCDIARLWLRRLEGGPAYLEDSTQWPNGAIVASRHWVTTMRT